MRIGRVNIAKIWHTSKMPKNRHNQLNLFTECVATLFTQVIFPTVFRVSPYIWCESINSGSLLFKKISYISGHSHYFSKIKICFSCNIPHIPFHFINQQQKETPSKISIQRSQSCHQETQNLGASSGINIWPRYPKSPKTITNQCTGLANNNREAASG